MQQASHLLKWCVSLGLTDERNEVGDGILIRTNYTSMHDMGSEQSIYSQVEFSRITKKNQIVVIIISL